MQDNAKILLRNILIKINVKSLNFQIQRFNIN